MKSFTRKALRLKENCIDADVTRWAGWNNKWSLTQFFLRKSMHFILGLACLSMSTLADAGPIAPPPGTVIGPFPDFIAHFEKSVLIDEPTPGGCTPPSTGFSFCWSDVSSFEIIVKADLYVDTYLTSDPHNPTFIQLVDVWAKDLNPPGKSPLNHTGFNPFDPELVPIGPENFIGRSGTLYPAPMVATTVASLPLVLPGFDLSPFQGDPTSIVYVAQATVPSLDFAAVPEPSTLALLGMAALVFLTLRGRQRPNRD